MPNRTSPRLISAVLLSLAVPGIPPGAAGQLDPGAERSIDALFTRFEDSRSPGAAVLVISDGRVVYRKGFGGANLEHEVPVTPATVFDIASVSKQFAGWAVAALVERGQIRLEDDIRTHLPELPDFGTPITVDHLVHHTSGVRDWPGTLAVAGWRMDDVISFDQILTMAQHQQDLNFVPGAEYSYSNTGYNILARLVEEVSGQSFRAWTHEHIFAPLGMADTHFHDLHTEIVPGRAQGYVPADGSYIRVANGLTALGSSSLFTTVDDLGRWAAHLNAPDPDGAGVVRRMEQRGVLNDGDTIAYAFGQSIGDLHGLTTWRHGGSWAGFRTVLLRIPERGFAAIVLSNAGNYNPGPDAERIAEIVLAVDADPAGDDEGEAPAPPVPPAVLDAYTGTYRLGPAWLLTVTRRGRNLEVQATGESRFSTRPVSPTEFFVPAYDASITFVRAGSGPATGIRYRGNEAPRVDVPPAAAVGLADYAGRYYSEELETAYVLRVEGDRLVAHHRRHGGIALSPVLPDEFGGDQWFFQGVEFDRDAAGVVTRMRVSNGRSRNLVFRRVAADGGR